MQSPPEFELPPVNPPTDDSPANELPADVPPRGHPWLAWAVIVVSVAASVLLALWHSQEAAATGDDQASSMVLELQAKYLVGAARFLPLSVPGMYYAQAKNLLNTGPASQRLRFVVLAGELAGPEEALSQLDRLDRNLKLNNTATTGSGTKGSGDKIAVGNAAGNKVELTPQQTAFRTILRRLYRDYTLKKMAAPSVSAEERELLEQSWIGRLALYPADSPETNKRAAVLESPRRIFLLLFLGVLAAGFAGLVGFVALVVFLVLAAGGHIHSRLGAFRSPIGIYAETFAVWFLLFNVLGWTARQFPRPPAPLMFSALLSFASLAALAWPVWRGLTWKQVREDLGLTWGRSPALEPLCGLAGYLLAIPMIFLGGLVTVALIKLGGGLGAAGGESDFGPLKTPSHPIIPFVAGGGWWERFQVVFLASVAAPIVEEIMFRGVLYRELRRATSRFHPAWGLLASAAVSSFVFAVIHPQGLVTVPALMGIAFGLCLAREWRGTLVPSMVAHGIHNGLLMTLWIVATG